MPNEDNGHGQNQQKDAGGRAAHQQVDDGQGRQGEFYFFHIVRHRGNHRRGGGDHLAAKKINGHAREHHQPEGQFLFRRGDAELLPFGFEDHRKDKGVDRQLQGGGEKGPKHAKKTALITLQKLAQSQIGDKPEFFLVRSHKLSKLPDAGCPRPDDHDFSEKISATENASCY